MEIYLQNSAGSSAAILIFFRPRLAPTVCGNLVESSSYFFQVYTNEYEKIWIIQIRPNQGALQTEILRRLAQTV
jgi:hypothetical protein